MMKKNNKGFSLIELLVVIAILGVFTGGSFVAFGLVQSGNVRNMTKTVSSGIQETRQKTMTQNLAYGWKFELDRNAEGVFNMSVVKGAANVLDREIVTTTLKKCELLYKNNDVPEVKISGMSMVFDPSTGAVKQIDYKTESGGWLTQTGGTAVIRAVAGTKESEMTIFFATGKCEAK